MLKILLFFIGLASIYAQDNRPWPMGNGPQSGPNSNPSQPGPVFGGSPWQNPNQPGQFGQNGPGPNQQQGWMVGSNQQFGGPGQPQHPSGLPVNNPPPGAVTGADRAVLSSGGPNGGNPQWGNPSNPGGPQWGNPNQPNWNQPGQPGQPGQQFWNQPGMPGQPGQPGQPFWNNDPRFGPGLNPAVPGNPNQPSWAQQNQYYASSSPLPYPYGRPYGGATSKRVSFTLISLISVLCFLRFIM